jgi:hypothetical protein
MHIHSPAASINAERPLALVFKAISPKYPPPDCKGDCGRVHIGAEKGNFWSSPAKTGQGVIPGATDSSRHGEIRFGIKERRVPGSPIDAKSLLW